MFSKIRNVLFLAALFLLQSNMAFAQATATADQARELNKQEILDLISNKTVVYKITLGARNTSADAGQNTIKFTKTDESGGTLEAFAKGSAGGKWYVNDKARLVREYDKVSWGNKPFSVGVVEKDGKYFWKLGTELQELVSIK